MALDRCTSAQKCTTRIEAECPGQGLMAGPLTLEEHSTSVAKEITSLAGQHMPVQCSVSYRFLLPNPYLFTNNTAPSGQALSTKQLLYQHGAPRHHTPWAVNCPLSHRNHSRAHDTAPRWSHLSGNITGLLCGWRLSPGPFPTAGSVTVHYQCHQRGNFVCRASTHTACSMFSLPQCCTRPH